MKLLLIPILLFFNSTLAAPLFKFTIKGNLYSSWSERSKMKRVYNPAIAIFEDKSVSISTKVRGNSRSDYLRNSDNSFYLDADGNPLADCPYPLLKIKFHEDVFNFKSNKAYKLVSHCNDRDIQPLNINIPHVVYGDDYLKREQFSYRIHNLLTKKSFRILPAEITYIDNDLLLPQVTRSAFFLERSKDVAKRLGFKYEDIDFGININDLSHDSILEMSIYNWFLGNNDSYFWKMPDGTYRAQNVKIYSNQDQLIPIIYDFDQTDIVQKNVPTSFELNVQCMSVSLETTKRILLSILKKKNSLQNLIETSNLNNIDKIYLKKYMTSKLTSIEQVLENNSLTIKEIPDAYNQTGLCIIEQ